MLSRVPTGPLLNQGVDLISTYVCHITVCLSFITSLSRVRLLHGENLRTP